MVEIFALIVVFSFFLANVLNSYSTFKEKATIESVEWVEHDSLPMPWVAVCLKNPYKVKPTLDNMLTFDGYKDITYDAKDYVIHIERTIGKNMETHQIKPDKKTVFTRWNGRCEVLMFDLMVRALV